MNSEQQNISTPSHQKKRKKSNNAKSPLSRPPPQQRHNPRAKHHTQAAIRQLTIARLRHLLAEQKLVREQLHEARVDQHAAAQRVHDPADDARGRALGVVRRPDAEPGGDADGGGEPVEDGGDDGDVVV